MINEMNQERLDEIEEYITTVSNYSTNYIINKLVDMYNLSQNEATTIVNNYLN